MAVVIGNTVTVRLLAQANTATDGRASNYRERYKFDAFHVIQIRSFQMNTKMLLSARPQPTNRARNQLLESDANYIGRGASDIAQGTFIGIFSPAYPDCCGYCVYVRRNKGDAVNETGVELRRAVQQRACRFGV